ncbi:CbtB domain-containing protein [Methyloligella sp. 2.7D]|uniref:CbtB domain-containing protein n=1 Tax=unclassified Methyloligella TaxID=2625955 RepID=UPI00157CF31D|nr:CbtB domain-containing protein [Methyloligella sp. GL2]QKP78173.1 CbtB-domain containing protein [Methyloligella sp. GL2]
MNAQTYNSTAAASSERSQVIIAATIALVFGLGLVFTTGFAHSSSIHNAAHDTRHALSFPCH